MFFFAASKKEAIDEKGLGWESRVCFGAICGAENIFAHSVGKLGQRRRPETKQ